MLQDESGMSSILRMGIVLKLAYYFCKRAIATRITSKTKHIVILGSKGAGKTTLWNRLQNKIDGGKTLPTDLEPVNSFIIMAGDRSVRISSTKDVGGDDLWVKDYEEIIKSDGIFIYYLVDLTNLHEKARKQEIRARLMKISEIIKNKNLKNCGCKILATNYRAYQESGLEKQYGSPAAYVKQVLQIHTLGPLSMKIEDFVSPVELTDDKCINKIKEEITQTGTKE